MYTLFILLCLGALALGHYGPKQLVKWQKALDEKRAGEQDYKDRTLRALERLSSEVPDHEDVKERSALDSFLEGNKKILEKQKVRQAMSDELGIDL
jgi:hypothetical protein